MCEAKMHYAEVVASWHYQKCLFVHTLFVHCYCHKLQLACVQAANATTGIEHVYVTLWKFFHYSPKRAESLKEVQKVLHLPELKIVKPSDTRWLAHARCVQAAKAMCYRRLSRPHIH